MAGLFKVDGKPEVYYVDGTTKRWIPTSQDLLAEFGNDAFQRVQTVSSEAELNGLTSRGLFGIPGLSGGGTISFGNQQVKGSIWLWLGVALLAAYFLIRR